VPISPPTPLARALALAATQHGLITAIQCQEVGLSRSATHRLVAKGTWIREAPGVYRVAGVPRTWEGRALCAALTSGHQALVSHLSAAHLWGLEGFSAPGRIDVTVRRHASPAPRRGVVVHESLAMELADPRRRWGVPVTGPARTFLDIAAIADEEIVVLRALDEIRRQRHARWVDLWAALLRHAERGRPGIVRARAALHKRAGKRVPDTELARLFLQLLEAAGLPEPLSEFQVRVAGHRYRLDCAYPGPLVAIELDGRGHEEPWQARSDARRDAHLEAAGWIVRRYTWPRFSHAPDEVVADVRAALVARGALPAPPIMR
jgi:very-short-patch-repair endonuclease